MVLPIVLGTLAVVAYFLTKPKKSDSDIYGKDSEPKKTTTKFDKFYDWVTNPENKKEYYDSPEIKNDNIKLTGSEKVILKDWVYKNPNWKSIDDLPNDIFLPIVKKAGDDTDKRVNIQTQTIKFMKIVTPKKLESKEKTNNFKLTNKELKEKLNKITYKISKGSDPNNPENYKKTFIDLENYALDFNKRYEFVSITKTGNVILKSDRKNKRFIGKVQYDESNKVYKLRTEGSRFSITLDGKKAKPLICNNCKNESTTLRDGNCAMCD